LKLLIVDDDEDNVTRYSTQLTNRGIEVIYFHKAQECLEYVKNNLDVDIILLDIIMPDLSGIELLKILRKEFSPLELPIIMLTNKSNVEDVVEALKLKANDYLTKPVNIDIAVARINTQLSMKNLYLEHLEKECLESVNEMIKKSNNEISLPLENAINKVQKYLNDGLLGDLDIVKANVNEITAIVKKVSFVTDESKISIKLKNNKKSA